MTRLVLLALVLVAVLLGRRKVRDVREDAADRAALREAQRRYSGRAWALFRTIDDEPGGGWQW